MIDWWENIIFADKWALWFLLAIPLIAVVIFLTAGKGRPVLRLSSFRFLSSSKAPRVVKWRPMLYVIRLLALIVLIMAFARPQSRLEYKKAKGEGIDIMLSIDVSPSMEASDFFPTRIEAAKTQAQRFIDNRPDDRIGVVIFSGETFTMCPLTSDHEALKSLVKNINSDDLAMGTAIGMGLAKAVERLQASTAKSKIVVLLTDGENNAGIISPEDAGRLAHTYGIKVYTIGLGATDDQALAPVSMNPDGTYVQQYQDVDIDEAALMNISKITGGQYFRAGDDTKLASIYDEINKMEKTEFDKKDTEQRKEESMPFIIVAVALVAIEFLLRYTVFESLT